MHIARFSIYVFLILRNGPSVLLMFNGKRYESRMYVRKYERYANRAYQIIFIHEYEIGNDIQATGHSHSSIDILFASHNLILDSPVDHSAAGSSSTALSREYCTARE